MQKPRLIGIRRRKIHRAPPGAAPGTVIAQPDAPSPVVRAFGYGPDDLFERELSGAGEIEGLLGKWPVLWINVDGLGDPEALTEIGELFGLHRLAIEDVANVHQNAKMEPYGDILFVTMRVFEVEDHVVSEQFSLFVGPGFVVTFQERPGDCFGPVRERIRRASGGIRTRGSDYLAYALIDAVIDNYYPIVEKYDDRLDALEQDVMAATNPDTIGRIHVVRKDLLNLRRAVWPLREAVNSLIRDPGDLMSDETRVFLRDCYDHTVQLVDTLETLRETAAGLVDLHLSGMSNRMNEAMKVLAVIATLFIPLTFVTGVYGMNFNTEVSPWNLPELGWYFGYPIVLLVMAAIVLVQLYLFKRNGWIGRRRSKKSELPPW